MNFLPSCSKRYKIVTNSYKLRTIILLQLDLNYKSVRTGKFDSKRSMKLENCIFGVFLFFNSRISPQKLILHGTITLNSESFQNTNYLIRLWFAWKMWRIGMQLPKYRSIGVPVNDFPIISGARDSSDYHTADKWIFVSVRSLKQ